MLGKSNLFPLQNTNLNATGIYKLDFKTVLKIRQNYLERIHKSAGKDVLLDHVFVHQVQGGVSDELVEVPVVVLPRLSVARPAARNKHLCIYSVAHRVPYTQSGNGRFLAYIPSRWKNQPWLVRVGGARPPPFTLLTRTKLQCKYAPT